ncbi:MAG: hypothetical protein JWN44_1995 [Myxococcales bacterium]|nr:hypothetical protein [Myxococcales bacterium]
MAEPRRGALPLVAPVALAAFVALTAFVALAVHPVAARAAECALPNGAVPSLADADSEVRLSFVQLGMRRAARQSRIWAWSSAGALAFAAGFQLLGATHVPDEGDRVDLYIGAASVGFSLAQLAIFYPRVTIDQWTLDRHVAHAGRGVDRCALVAEAEYFLIRDARSEEIATGPAMQAVTFLFNIGTGLVLGIAFDRWHSAAINMFLGAALGELQIVTQPTDAITLLRRYRAGDLAPGKEARASLGWHVAPTALRDGFGLAFGAAY